MSDIRITFDDDSTELRDRQLPCVWSDAPLRRPFEERWYLYFPATPESPANWSFCGFTIRNIAACRGRRVWVWCETGTRVEGQPLTGEWRRARVETVEEQIGRLTRERDEARAEKMEFVGIAAEWRRSYDRAWMERDDARRIAVLDRKPLTKEEHVEMRFLVEQAKREGWL